MSYSSGIFRVKRYICFDFKFAQKASFDGPLDPQKVTFHCFLFYKPVPSFFNCICQYVINQVPLLNNSMLCRRWKFMVQRQ